MEKSKRTYGEAEKLEILKNYHILDSEEEEEFDNITRLAAEICQVPFSLISLFDSGRQWFKSSHGLHIREIPEEHSFCRHALKHPGETLLVSDSAKDKRFVDNPLVTGYPHVRFYAGAPLLIPQGFALGTLCVFDQQPATLSKTQLSSLQMLAKQVIQLMELRKANLDLKNLKSDLESRNSELEQFAYVVSHDIKSPLASIVLVSEMLRENFGGSIDEGSDQLLNVLNRASSKIKNLADGILSYYHGERALNDLAESFNLGNCIQEIIDLMRVNQQTVIHFPREDDIIHTNKTAFEQILINLIQNALKYSDKEKTIVEIRFRKTDEFYAFEVQDNGRGIPEADRQKIFEPFTTLGIQDRSGVLGTGIGLSIVKKLIEKQGGQIQVWSAPAGGSIFAFTLRKFNAGIPG